MKRKDLSNTDQIDALLEDAQTVAKVLIEVALAMLLAGWLYGWACRLWGAP
jgi:hypothetical protein